MRLQKLRGEKFEAGTQDKPPSPAEAGGKEGTPSRKSSEPPVTPASPIPSAKVNPRDAEGESLAEQTLREEVAQPPSAEYLTGGEMEAEKKGGGPLRILAQVMLLLVVLGAAYVGFLLFSNRPLNTPGSPVAIASRTLAPTWTPAGENAAEPQTTPSAEISSLSAPDTQTQAQMEAIAQAVSGLRGMEQVGVENALIPTESAAALLANTYLDQTKAQQLGDAEGVLKAFGLLGANDHLLDYELNSHADPLGGFYLPSENRIYVAGDSLTGLPSYLYARLFDRALERSNSPTLEENLANCSLLSDACRALKALAFGDSAFMGEQWLQANGGNDLAQQVSGLSDGALFIQAQQPPDFVKLDLGFPYQQGLSFVKSIFDLGGWDGVNGLYANPPASSEQILHPEKYAAGEGPQVLSDNSAGSALGSGWTPLGTGTLGEWSTYLLLSHGAQATAHIPEEQAASAAAGWGGDFFQAYVRQADGATVLAEHWIMDNQLEASELSSAMQDYLSLRFSDQGSPIGSGLCRLGSGQRACLYAHGSEVLWLLGPDEIVVLQVVLAQYPQFQ